MEQEKTKKLVPKNISLKQSSQYIPSKQTNKSPGGNLGSLSSTKLNKLNGGTKKQPKKFNQYPDIWRHNGQYIVKKRYEFTEIGLEHYYEKGNVEEFKPLSINKQTKIKPTPYKEYYNSKPGQYIITIEYCSSCDEHSNITQHAYIIFKELALKYQRIIQERFPFIKVILKPINVNTKGEGLKLPKLKNAGDRSDEEEIIDQSKCRIGAFEIQISCKDEKGNVKTKIIHSKLEKKKFPKVKDVLKEIRDFMPTFNLNLVLFDKEDYEDINKMNGIEVRIYQCNSDIIKEVGESSEKQVLNFISPQKRFQMIQEKRLLDEKSPAKRGFSLEDTRKKSARTNPTTKKYRINSGNSTTVNRTNIFRPMTSNNFKNLGFYNTLNMNKNFNMMNSTDSAQGFYQCYPNEEELLKLQKGELKATKFSRVEPFKPANKKGQEEGKDNANNHNVEEEDDRSESVTIKFNPLSYDTYIIETKENCNFKGSLTLLKFNEINFDNQGEVTKYIGLWHQNHAILNIHLYMEKEIMVPITSDKSKEGESNPKDKAAEGIKEAEANKAPGGSSKRQEGVVNGKGDVKYKPEIDHVPITTGTITISYVDDPNSRYEVYPNSVGIYEYKTEPGEYKLEVTNKDCEKEIRKVKLIQGLNVVNIKMNSAKHCDLVIQVLEYDEVQQGLSYIDENEEDKKKLKSSNQNEDNSSIRTIPVRNAEIQIYKNGNDLIKEGITNRRGIMNYLVDKNENNLSIKVSKNEYFRAERCFKRSGKMKENEKGNYDCIITFILVKRDILIKYNKILFISYSNMCKKIFDIDYQNNDTKHNQYEFKDMQKQSGIFLATFSREVRERDEVNQMEHCGSIRECNDSDDINKSGGDKAEISKQNAGKQGNDATINEQENNNYYDQEDYVPYDEIIRFGFKILPDAIKEEAQPGDDNLKLNKEIPMDDIDMIEYLKEICCEGNIYTPRCDFHINLPKVLSKNIITPKDKGEYYEDVNDYQGQDHPMNPEEQNLHDNSAFKGNKSNGSKLHGRSRIRQPFNGLYWDLGWLDVKNYLYYETSVYFHIENVPRRLLFFDNFVDFLQVFIDKKIFEHLFTFFGFENSVLAGSDRYLAKIMFGSKMNQIMEYQYAREIEIADNLANPPNPAGQNENINIVTTSNNNATGNTGNNVVVTSSTNKDAKTNKDEPNKQVDNRNSKGVAQNSDKDVDKNNPKLTKNSPDTNKNPGEILVNENRMEPLDPEQAKERREKEKERAMFIEFICNILCGYDEDKNIRDDSISYNLLRKKISSNLMNFEESYDEECMDDENGYQIEEQNGVKM